MAAGRSDNSMFYGLITFVFLFIVSTVFAVIFYIKFADYQKTVLDAEKRVQELASASQIKNVGALVGTKEDRTVLGTLLTRFDAMTQLVLGTVDSEQSAEVKVLSSQQQARDILSKLDLQGAEVNSVGLIQALEVTKAQLDNMNEQAAVNAKIAEITQLFDEDKKATLQKEKETSEFIAKLQADSERATKGYEDLKALMKQNADQQIAGLATKLEATDAQAKKDQQDLLAAQAKLKSADDRINNLQGQLEKIVPKPDNTAAAFKPDGKVISIDTATNTVIINLGNSDRIYRGLTFSVYDKGLPIPRDGKGKATVEVFDVQANVAIARVTEADKRNPIMQDDKIANLIWDADTKREFVVAGAFTFGQGTTSIKNLIEKWGGSVADNVSITTSFVVLGSAPVLPQKPTIEAREADPRANEKYDADLAAYARYNNIVDQAKMLSIPVFNTERFLDFIGYSAQAKL